MATASVEPRTAAANAPSRRNLLSIIAFAPVAALPLPAIAARPASSAWDAMMRAYQHAREASDTYEKGTYDPAVAAVERVAPYPRMSFRVPDRHGYSPDHPVYPHKLDEWDDHMSPLYRDAAAAVRAKYLAWEAAGKRAGLDEIEMHADELGQRRDDTNMALLRARAPNLPALLWKVQELFGEDSRDHEGRVCSWSDEIMVPFLADARRLLGDA